MDDHLRTLLKEELKTQCEYAEIAASDLDSGLRGESGRTWYGIQGILVAAGNAAKLLWGSQGKETEAARKPFRDFVGVDDSSPLKIRSVRNAFEHFDEFLEEWFEAGDTNIFISRNVVGRTDQPLFEGHNPEREFGRLNLDTGVVTFWNRSFPVREVLAELRRIYSRIAPQ